MTVIEGINIFLYVISDRRCVRVFEFLVYLGARAYTVVLLKALHARNLLLLRLPSCLIVTAFHRSSIKFPFGLSRSFEGGRWI